MSKFTAQDIPAQTGRLAIITGTGGLGLEDAAVLAGAGAEVIVAGRNPLKGVAAVTAIRERVPDAAASFETLDLADLDSIAAFAGRVHGRTDRLDLLINNAGVMTPPDRETTRDGFELQFGTNYLGHFALTALLAPLMRATPGARVVGLSSVAARSGAIDFDDLNAERAYDPMRAYSQSKLACLMFSLELQKRSEAGGWGFASMAAHPGVARTDLLHNAPGRNSVPARVRSWLWFLFQPVAQGALPTLYAATYAGAKPGGYYGPDGLAEVRGYPTEARIPVRAHDQGDRARLWSVSERMTGLRLTG